MRILANSLAVLSPLLLSVIVATIPSTLSAQAPPDSIGVWTALLEQGTLSDRARAAVFLRKEDPSALPLMTQAAVIAELLRVNDALLTGQPLPGEDDAFGPEGFGQYRMVLASMVADINTDEARKALVPAVGISRGIQRRVARLGDAAVPELAMLLGQNFETLGVLNTMGLAWFWADSVNAPLSDDSREIIVRSLAATLSEGGTGSVLGAAYGLMLSGDPAFLPLAVLVEQRARLAGPLFLSNALASNVIPPLEETALARSGESLLGGTVRTAQLLCRSSTGTFCAAVLPSLSTAQEQLAVLALESAEAALLNAIALSDAALANGSITPEEHALIAGGAEQVMDLGFSILRPTATADTYLKQGTPNKNQGTDSIMRVRQSGKNRGLVRFDDAVFAGVAGQIVSARIEVDIVFNANNWGATGRTVDAHRMLVAWTELGATWNCGDDSDTSDQSPDCGTTAWQMRSLSPSPFESTPSGTLLVTKDLTGTMSFDVTADVRAIVAGQLSNFGWILKKTKEGQPGHIQLGTKESGAPARLVIEVIN